MVKENKDKQITIRLSESEYKFIENKVKKINEKAKRKIKGIIVKDKETSIADFCRNKIFLENNANDFLQTEKQLFSELINYYDKMKYPEKKTNNKRIPRSFTIAWRKYNSLWEKYCFEEVKGIIRYMQNQSRRLLIDLCIEKFKENKFYSKIRDAKSIIKFFNWLLYNFRGIKKGAVIFPDYFYTIIRDAKSIFEKVPEIHNDKDIII